MIHYTTNTGHWIESPKDEVWPETLLRLQPLTQRGTHRLPGYDNFEVDVAIYNGCAGFSIYETSAAQRVPVVCCGLAWTAEKQVSVSRKLEQLSAAGGIIVTPAEPFPPVPKTVPWLGVTLFEGVALLGERIAEIADFERCLAWAIIESVDRA